MKNKLILITAFVIISANAMGQLLNETVFDVDSNLYHKNWNTDMDGREPENDKIQ